uniref:Uncharacterized protein n=1 Tax=Nelumbo nucifera TaxID=4432 RepID=A0A822Z5N6_NELNU|nr:TPA_asm: hypothetical protein HUJ06_014715 [Nelumbo nucifera]
MGWRRNQKRKRRHPCVSSVKKWKEVHSGVSTSRVGGERERERMITGVF